MPRKSLYKICIHDILLAAFLGIAAVLLLVFFTIAKGNDPGKSMTVTVNGTLYGTYALAEDQTIRIETDLGSNTLVIENGTVRMQEADCPDHYCVSKGMIGRKGETIVCLPHRVVAEIQGDNDQTKDEEFDIIAQ